jgi:mannitol/fructose-specific phosphotransferase system IIA component
MTSSDIEFSKEASNQRSILESISNHLQANGAVRDEGTTLFPDEQREGDDD